MDKEYISAQDMLRYSFALARNVFDSGYRPDLIIALWRGGAPVALALHEFFLYKRISVEMDIMRISSYSGINRQAETVIEDANPVLDRLRADQKVLVVDDIFDTGMTFRHVLSVIGPRIAEARIAALYRKSGGNLSGIEPDYTVLETERWVVFPHELVGLSPDELLKKNERIGIGGLFD
ncbi:MAG: hypoxanthine phosphoribosyltransferase [Lentisphaerae bacterium]|nr:hypoxanthine phosphoribosyltransferase [Lentisphaerota bacterium]